MAELLWWHRAGQRIVCAKPFNGLSQLFAGVVPTFGETYTIRVAHVVGGLVGFYLEEIVAARFHGVELDYGSTHFRPSRETSIESLRELLNPPPETKRQIFDEIIEEAHASLSSLEARQ